MCLQHGTCCTWPDKGWEVAVCPVWPRCDGDLGDGAWRLQKAEDRGERRREGEGQNAGAESL